VLLSGCATFEPRAGFLEVSDTVKARSGMDVAWNPGTELDAQAAQKVRELLARPLTLDAAVQVALLNNRDLQATYAELGLAQADLVQAGLLKNPVFDIGLKFPLSGGVTNLELGTALDFLDILYLPLRKRVAVARFEDAKLQVTGAVLDFAAAVQAAFYRHQANEQSLDLFQSIAQGLALSLEVAQRLLEAGNITDLDVARERALAEQAKLQFAVAELATHQSREQLNLLMGLWGDETAWAMTRRLPDIPDQPIPLDGLERQAIGQSLELASARQQIIAAGEQAGFTRATALVPELSLGALAEREGGDEGGSWQVGPGLEISLPLFDQAQARIGRAYTETRRAQQAYYALGVRIRATVRAVRASVQGMQSRALYYRDILLPLRERIVNEAQLQYNAMQLGVFGLLQAQEQQIQTAGAYVEALRDYWLARTDLGQLLSGRLPASVGVEISRSQRPSDNAANGGH
jgi:cobalt-zinc-cadmium efflux system outer membrane protein